MRTTFLMCVCVALPALTSALSSLGEDDLACATGFHKVAESSGRITCLRSLTVADEKEAEKLASQWKRRARCSGQVEERQSSVAGTGDGGWLVTARFVCGRER